MLLDLFVGSNGDMWQRLWREVTGLPWLMRVGLAILVVGGVLDVTYHTAPAGWHTMLNIYLGSDGYYAHLTTLVGMILTLSSVLIRSRNVRTANDSSSAGHD